MATITGIAQIALSVRDLPRATAFYRDALGLKHLFDAPQMSFFALGGTRLMLSAQGGEPGNRATLVYFAVEDIEAAHATRGGRIREQEVEPEAAVLGVRVGRVRRVQWLIVAKASRR